MKLKCQPEDFQVEELTTVAPSDHGKFTLYRLTKRNLGTIEALAEIRRRWNLAPAQVASGGLKDRHAVTIQYLTIADGPKSSIQHRDFTLVPLGKSTQPYSPRCFRGNRFELVIRDLTEDALAACQAELAQIPQDGLPNYFDDQRFGSVGRSGQFLGEAWFKGDYERALKLALADENPFDRASGKAVKRLVQENWGDWKNLKAKLDRSSTRSIVTYLVDHPSDHAGAFARLPRDLRSLLFSAYQSYLWNAVLDRFLVMVAPARERGELELKLGRFAFPRGISTETRARLVDESLPLPSARSPEPQGPLGEAVASILAQAGLSWRDLRIKKLKDVFLSKGLRNCLFEPVGLEHSAEADALHPRRRALRLRFELGKGSYATILVKRITQAAGAIQDEGR